MLEVLYHRAKFGGARILPATVTATNVEFFCRFVRHAFVTRSLLGGAMLGYHLFLLIIVVRNCT